MNPIRWKLHWQIFASLTLAVITAIVITQTDLQNSGFHEYTIDICDRIGKIFMNALKMVVVPLIVSSIIGGMMSLGSESNFSRMGLKTLGYYCLTGLLAVLVGLAAVNIIKPGEVTKEEAEKILHASVDSQKLIDSVHGQDANSMIDILYRLFPSNIFQAATDNGALLGLIVFSLLFGYFISKLPKGLRESQEKFWEGAQQVMMMITNLIIKFAPIGIFGLVTPTIVNAGFASFKILALFAATVLIALSIHMLVVLPLLMKLFANINPYRHLKAMAPVLLTAFSTASSASTLPLTMDTVKKDANVSNKTASFTLPLGATVNMDGTALYECVVVIFLAQIYGVLEGFSFGLTAQFSVVLMALLTSIGVAGIPHASLTAILVILPVVGLPVEAIGLIWVTDRVLDMCRTSVNVFSDTCGAVIIAKSEGEKDVYS